MSYNIDSIEYIGNGRLIVSESVYRDRAENDDYPESVYEDPTPLDEVPGFVRLDHVDWCGDGSGHTYESGLIPFLRKTVGRADLILCWEGGDSYTGLRVVDGVVTRHEVVMSLGEEEED